MRYKIKKIIAVDFDDTLAFTNYPDIISPNKKMINFIKENKDKYIFILWTCRHDEYLEDAIKWLKEEHNLEFDYVNENIPELILVYGDTRKIYADYYIDDKSINLLKLLNLEDI